MKKKLRYLVVVGIVVMLVNALIASALGAKDIIRFGSGTMGGTDDPRHQLALELVRLYNAMQDEVEVQFEAYIGTAGGRKFWTTLAAGNPPDIYRQSMGGLYGGFSELPLLVPIDKYVTKEERKDFAPWLEKTVRGPQGQLIGYPEFLFGGSVLTANGDLFEKAGIDWKKIQAEGWTWQEFRDYGKKLQNLDVWPLLTRGAWGPFVWFENALAMNNGVSQFHVGMPWYGNEFNYSHPQILEALQFAYDLIWVDKFSPEGQFSLSGSTATDMLLTNKVAMVLGTGYVYTAKRYNEQIAKGELPGAEPVDINLILLPPPHKEGKPMGMDVRADITAVFKQAPYQGDEHTERVFRFVKFLISPAIQGLRRTIDNYLPTRKSTLDMVPKALDLSDPNTRFIYDYMVKYGMSVPMNHPAYQVFQDDIWKPLVDKCLVEGAISPEEAMAEWTKRGKKHLGQWIEENPEAAKEWLKAKPLPGWKAFR